MNRKVFKVHTDTFGRLAACIKHAMYGISSSAMRKELPKEMESIGAGDIIFISEKQVSNNALFGPFYVVNDRPPIVVKKRKGCWCEIDIQRTSPREIAYWVQFENRYWCLLFDKTLADKLSIVWPYNWKSLRVNLPPWGRVTGEDAAKLIDFAIANEAEAREFLAHHEVWK